MMGPPSAIAVGMVRFRFGFRCCEGRGRAALSLLCANKVVQASSSLSFNNFLSHRFKIFLTSWVERSEPHKNVSCGHEWERAGGGRREGEKLQCSVSYSNYLSRELAREINIITSLREGNEPRPRTICASAEERASKREPRKYNNVTSTSARSSCKTPASIDEKDCVYLWNFIRSAW